MYPPKNQIRIFFLSEVRFELTDVPPHPRKVGFCSIWNFSHLFPPKWLRMTQKGQFCPIHNFSNLFPPKWPRMTQNSQFCLICNFSNLFLLKWLRMTWNGRFCPICNFSNLLPPKPPRMTWNGQSCMAKIKYTLIQGNFYESYPSTWTAVP